MLTLRRKGNCREDAVLTKSYLNISIADPSALGPVTPEEAQMLARLDLARPPRHVQPDRKSTRLNSRHTGISYAVFCLKKKNYAPSKLYDTLPHRIPTQIDLAVPR